VTGIQGYYNTCKTFSSLVLVALASILYLAKVKINFALHITTTELDRQGNTTELYWNQVKTVRLDES
jgi:hypothetical protein